MGDDPRRLERLAVHLARGRAVGAHDRVVGRIAGVLEEHRPAGDVGRQHARRDHHEVRFAEGVEAGVVEHAQGQTGGGLGHGHDRGHAAVDRDRPALGPPHQAAEDLLQQEGVLDEFLGGFQRGSRQLEVLRCPAPGPLDGGLVGPGGLDQLGQLLVLDGAEVQLPAIDGQLRGLGADAPPAGPPDGHDPAAERAAQAAQGPQAPEQLVGAVDHHVQLVHALADATIARSAPQQARAHRGVRGIERLGKEAAEDDRVLAQLDDGLAKAAEPVIARRIKQEHVGRGQVRHGVELAGIAHEGYGEELHRKISRCLEPGQLGGNVHRLAIGILLGLNAAPDPPTGLGRAG